VLQFDFWCMGGLLVYWDDGLGDRRHLSNIDLLPWNVFAFGLACSLKKETGDEAL
jgi:hypothetical protein